MSAPIRLVVAGAGGFAREVAYLARCIEFERPGSFSFVGYVVTDLSKLGPYDSREQVLGDLDWLDAHRADFDGFALGIGSPAAKLRVAAAFLERFPEKVAPNLVHPSAIFERESADLGRGVVVCAGVVGTVGLRLGDFSMVNLCTTLGHEARLDAGVVLNPTVNISGGVRVGEGALVGTGAQILQYVTVGARATVGAGAVVTRDVPEGITVVGAPAKPLVKVAK